LKRPRYLSLPPWLPGGPSPLHKMLEPASPACQMGAEFGLQEELFGVASQRPIQMKIQALAAARRSSSMSARTPCVFLAASTRSVTRRRWGRRRRAKRNCLCSPDTPRRRHIARARPVDRVVSAAVHAVVHGRGVQRGSCVCCSVSVSCPHALCAFLRRNSGVSC
jgi:hypothetical protein